MVFKVVLKPEMERQKLSLEYHERLSIFGEKARPFFLFFVEGLERKISSEASPLHGILISDSTGFQSWPQLNQDKINVLQRRDFPTNRQKSRRVGGSKRKPRIEYASRGGSRFSY